VVVALIILAAYLITGACFWPRFAYEWYQREDAKYYSLTPNKGEGVFISFFHALFWPITLTTTGITGYIEDKVEKSAQDEIQAEKDAEELKRLEAVLKKERLTQKLMEDAGLLIFEHKLVTTIDEADRYNSRVREFVNDYHSKNKGLRISEIASTLEPLIFDLRNDKTLERG